MNSSNGKTVSPMQANEIRISFPSGMKDGVQIHICGSKSQSNRMLVLRAVTGAGLTIDNLSDSDDTVSMQNLVSSCADTVDIGHAGTTMRFGTAYFASREGRRVTLTGSSRMKERPIYPLVDALRSLGADISYAGRDGFPPLDIRGVKIKGGRCTVDSSVSSQFVTALLLAAPSFENGIELHLSGRSVSKPYIRMTLAALAAVGAKCRADGDVITVEPLGKPFSGSIKIESDWSSASYFFSFAALARKSVSLSSYFYDSVQGDSKVADIYRNFGVEASVTDDVVRITPAEGYVPPASLCLDMEDTPDLAQSVAVTMAAMGIKGMLTGLSTLRVKETDRIAAMEAELEKFGVMCRTTDDSLEITHFGCPKDNILLRTYQDHRMAMAFAPLALKMPFSVENPGVAAKSYPRFWDDFLSIGGQMEIV